MPIRRVVVIGGGVTGLATALLAARRDAQVTIVERDVVPAGPIEMAPDLPRPGVPHYLQPHAFIPRARLELRRELPDVYDELLGAGASEVDLRAKLPGPVRSEDADLVYLAVRRPLIEWALRSAVAAEPGITVAAGVRVHALTAEQGTVTGVRTDDGELPADLVVDAHGRRPPPAGWLPSTGATEPEPTVNSCGVVYYCRYYRQRPGFDLPDGPWFLSPRGDLGYLAFATFPGDNGTFAGLLAAPAGVLDWRVLNHPPAFEAAVARIPALASWVNRDGVDPITDVMPMAGLRNSFTDRASPMPGLLLAGDAYCHTDPTLAHGLAFGLIHAAAIAGALSDHADVVDAADAYAVATLPELQERFSWASALDEQRLRNWMGESVDAAHHDGDYALFTMTAAGAVARVDPDVFRVFNRRIGLLDRTGVLDDDLALQRHIEARFAELRATPSVPLGPPPEELLAAARAAAA
ncbi:MAG: NAD(P)/FAD-dependent oxidoreductase [Jatrophihabitans sp.]|uniref:NAD(P)/FAD-dependent oxidoreductase n=1 Tax=Jatrophihabitans sp. TaxID=1932789 RepID=UPI00390E57EF